MFTILHYIVLYHAIRFGVLEYQNDKHLNKNIANIMYHSKLTENNSLEREWRKSRLTISKDSSQLDHLLICDVTHFTSNHVRITSGARQAQSHLACSFALHQAFFTIHIVYLFSHSLTHFIHTHNGCLLVPAWSFRAVAQRAWEKIQIALSAQLSMMCILPASRLREFE